MVYINEVVKKLLADGYNRADIAEALGVTTAMISTWLNKENDFAPRLPVAKKIYKAYGIITYPYGEQALDGTV